MQAHPVPAPRSLGEHRPHPCPRLASGTAPDVPGPAALAVKEGHDPASQWQKEGVRPQQVCCLESPVGIRLRLSPLPVVGIVTVTIFVIAAAAVVVVTEVTSGNGGNNNGNGSGGGAGSSNSSNGIILGWCKGNCGFCNYF